MGPFSVNTLLTPNQASGPFAHANGKFSTIEVATLRNDLRRHGFDSFQVAETIKMFVTTHGYGISAEMARDIASTLEGAGYSADFLHQQLEMLALVM